MSIENEYHFIRPINRSSNMINAYLSLLDKKKYSIKQMAPIRNPVEAKKTLRELRILNKLQHENITDLSRVFLVFDEPNGVICRLSTVTGYMESNLFEVREDPKTRQNDDHIKWFIFSQLKAVTYLHSVGYVHRDIKLENILINTEQKIKLCGFGHVKDVSRKITSAELLDFAAPIPNRAPELLFNLYGRPTFYANANLHIPVTTRIDENDLINSNQAQAVDIFSIGTCMMELITGQSLFKSINYEYCVKTFVELYGRIPNDSLSWVRNDNQKRWISSLNGEVRRPTHIISGYSNPQALDLIDKMLEFSPLKRISAKEALNHPYFKDVYLIEDDVSPLVDEIIQYGSKFDNDFENNPRLTLSEYQIQIIKEINDINSKSNYQIYNYPISFADCNEGFKLFGKQSLGLNYCKPKREQFLPSIDFSNNSVDVFSVDQIDHALSAPVTYIPQNVQTNSNNSMPIDTGFKSIHNMEPNAEVLVPSNSTPASNFYGNNYPAIPSNMAISIPKAHKNISQIGPNEIPQNKQQDQSTKNTSNANNPNFKQEEYLGKRSLFINNQNDDNLNEEKNIESENFRHTESTPDPQGTLNPNEPNLKPSPGKNELNAKIERKRKNSKNIKLDAIKTKYEIKEKEEGNVTYDGIQEKFLLNKAEEKLNKYSGQQSAPIQTTVNKSNPTNETYEDMRKKVKNE